MAKWAAVTEKSNYTVSVEANEERYFVRCDCGHNGYQYLRRRQAEIEAMQHARAHESIVEIANQIAEAVADLLIMREELVD